MKVVYEIDSTRWQPEIDDAERARVALALEQGLVIELPHLAFSVMDGERALFSPQWLSGKRKNISLEGREVRGAAGPAEVLQQLATMIGRFAQQASQLVGHLLPRYQPYLRHARTSFRPATVENRPTSWRKDDSRLHVDAFPSRPNRGERILRVFNNANPAGAVRAWRVGEPFADAAARFRASIPKPLPGSAALLQALHITKSRRSEYDHIMLYLHDAMKADMEYQRTAPQARVDFPAGSTWICFSDQVLHAASAGQYMFEQTIHLPVEAQYHPEISPLKTLERLYGRALI